MELKTSISQKQVLKVTPQLITTQHLFLLNTLELTQNIEAELEQNPALEVDEEVILTCPSCNSRITSYFCNECGWKREKEDEDEKIKNEITVLSEIMEEEEPFEYKVGSVNFTPPAYQTLSDYILLNISPITEKEEEIAQILIDNISDDGYLEVDVEEIARRTSSSVEEVLHVLKKIQTIDPPGIGARNIKESLLIQIEQCEEEIHIKEVAKEIIEKFFDKLSKHNYTDISRDMNIPLGDIRSVIEFIQKHTTPYPARGILQTKFSENVYVKPDVIIHKDKDEYLVEVVEGAKHNLRINPHYLDMYRKMREKKDEYSEEEINHVRNYIERAKLYLASISSRKEIIRKIVKAIIQYQKDFFEKKDRKYLSSLTQAIVANEVNVSESTVSRAISNKFVQLPWGEVVPLQLFFSSSESIKKQILEIIKNEDKRNPLSDQDISYILKQKGINIARRTVAKYREELNILPSSQRKSI